MANPFDLVSLATAQSELAASLPTDQSALPSVISAASRAVRKWTGRDFVLTSYDECYDGQGYNQLLLRQYPVNAVTRLATNPTTVLTVANTSAANQRATAALATTGDVDSGLTVTGLTLNRWASGVQTTNTVTFSGNVTIQAVATAVNALGNGWQATVGDGYGLWASADLRAVQGAQNASSSTGGAGAVFLIHVQDVNNWTLDERSGIVRLNNTAYDPVFALMNLNGPLLSVFPTGFQAVRVAYSAGYTTVPYDVQQATLITVRDMITDLQTVRRYQSETADDWTATLAGPEFGGLPEAAKRLLQPWRSFRRS